MLAAARKQVIRHRPRPFGGLGRGSGAVQDLKQKVEAESGFPVIEEEGELDAKIVGRAQVAWTRGPSWWSG
ncbi:hypothetical protein BH23VER1_BH23VER1_19140 [soil metagenome]